MSYADVAKQNAPPPSEQPHPDPALLTTPADVSTGDIPDPATNGVTVAPADYKEHPKAAAERIAHELEGAAEEAEEQIESSNTTGSAKRKARKEKEKGKEALREAEDKGLQLWERTKRVVLQPGVAGGLIGVVNVGLLGAIGYNLYNRPHLRQDTRFLSTSIVGTLALFGAEGYAAEKYRETPAGQREEAKAREEGAALYNHTKNIVLRPGVLGGLVGVLNVGILGGIGYWSYTNWDRPYKWDRQVASAVSVGLAALFAGEGYLGEKYKKEEYPKRK